MTENLFPRDAEWYKHYPGRLMQGILYEDKEDYVQVLLFEEDIAAFDSGGRDPRDLEAAETADDRKSPFYDAIAVPSGGMKRRSHSIARNGAADGMDVED